MSYFRFALVMFFMLIGSITAIPAQAQEEEVVTTVTPATSTTPTVVERHVIVTTVPAAKETIVIPPNYTNCFTVGGWFDDVWTPEHKVCLYKGANSGAVWIEGYWACTKYETNGNCLNWDWKTARWIY